MRNVHRVCTVCSENYIPNPQSQAAWTFCSFRCARLAWPEFVTDCEGHCLTCERALVPRTAFCNRDCRRDFAWNSGDPILMRCRFCRTGFPVRYSEWVRGGGAYCSHGCAGRNAGADVAPHEIDDAFGHWFAGLTDGEGSFDIQGNTQKGNSVRFILKLRDDDRPVLEMVRDTLGFGTLYDIKTGNQGGKKTNPQTSFTCLSTKSCAALLAVFERYPLRSKKRRDFDVWKLAVEGMSDGTLTHAEATRLRRLLMEGREYHRSLLLTNSK